MISGTSTDAYVVVGMCRAQDGAREIITDPGHGVLFADSYAEWQTVFGDPRINGEPVYMARMRIGDSLLSPAIHLREWVRR